MASLVLPHFVLTFPALSGVLACGNDTVYSKLLGPPQTHAGSASDSPADKQQHNSHETQIYF